MATAAVERVKDLVYLLRRVENPIQTARAARRAGLNQWHLKNGASFWMRGATSDMLAVREVILRDTYRLPSRKLDTVVDIGAHIGSFTARVSDRAERIFAFEAMATNHDVLTRCSSAHAMLTIQNVAVTGDGRTVEMFVHPDNTGQHSLFQHDPPAAIVEKLDSVSSADLLEKVGGHIDLLKVDVEGAEHEILTDELLHHTDDLIVEINEINEGSRAGLLERIKVAGLSVSYGDGIAHASRGPRRPAPAR